MTAAPLPDGTLAGYRLVRRLGSGSRADVYLGVGSTGSVALKVFRTETPRDSIGRELEALGRLESPHLPRLLDLSTSDEGVPILILELVGRGSVAALLNHRSSIECGEAVTLLAPIATLVGELAGVGVAHSRIGSSALFLGSEAQPVLMGFGHCELFEPGGTMAAIDAEPAAATDRDALARLALDTLARVREHGTSNRLGDLVKWIEEAPRAYEFPAELAERLFACAEPLPVAMSTERATSSPVPVRIRRDDAPATDPQPVVERVGGTEQHPSRAVPSWLSDLLQDNPATVIRKRVVNLIRGVRPRFWVVAGVGVFGLILAATLIPSGGVQRAASSRPAPAQSVTPAPRPATVPDDPLEAAKVLLTARMTCVHDLSILCLDGVDEASSSAFASDAASIQRVQQGGELPTDSFATGTQLTLAERLGDTALIGLGSSPSSILVIRTKLGWRIRDYLSGAQSTASP